MHELRVQRSPHRRQPSEYRRADRGVWLLAKTIDQIADPNYHYEKATDRVRQLLNESFYNRFLVDQDGSVGTDLDQPFDDIIAAQAAYRSIKHSPAMPVHGSTTFVR
ncbi:hypothetical protein [Arthrobacter sp. Sr33]